MLRPLLYFLVLEAFLVWAIIRLTVTLTSLGMALTADYAAGVFCLSTIMTLLFVVLIVSSHRRRWICDVCGKHFKAEYVRGSYGRD